MAVLLILALLLLIFVLCAKKKRHLFGDTNLDITNINLPSPSGHISTDDNSNTHDAIISSMEGNPAYIPSSHTETLQAYVSTTQMKDNPAYITGSATTDVLQNNPAYCINANTNAVRDNSAYGPITTSDDPVYNYTTMKAMADHSRSTTVNDIEAEDDAEYSYASTKKFFDADKGINDDYI